MIYVLSTCNLNKKLYYWQTPDFKLHCESKKLGHFFTAYNFRNIEFEQIFTKFGTNQSLFILNIVPEFI